MQIKSLALALSLVAAPLAAPLAANAQGMAAPAKDIVTVAVENGSFKTLAAALTASGLKVFNVFTVTLSGIVTLVRPAL